MLGGYCRVVVRAKNRSVHMLQSMPGLLLVVMIILTLILLPYLNQDPQANRERTGRTEELHIKSRREK